MYKISLYSVGKNKERWLQEALDLYQTRLSNQIKLQFIWVKNSNQLLKFLENEKILFALTLKAHF